MLNILILYGMLEISLKYWFLFKIIKYLYWIMYKDCIYFGCDYIISFKYMYWYWKIS